MNHLQAKVVVITGASSGIGEQMARKVASLGGRPILLARSRKKLEVICEDINQNNQTQAVYYPLDVSDVKAVETVFQQIYAEVGSIDILVNNAGFGVFDLADEAKMEDIQSMFQVNVIGLIACTKAVLPKMLQENKGHIINLASIAGKLATPKSSVYAATKHAVLGFTNSLRMEVAKTNIQISAVNPGPIETNFFQTADKTGTYVKNVKSYMLSAETVATKVIKLMQNPRREINLPRWMNWGSILYHLFPTIADKVMGSLLNKK